MDIMTSLLSHYLEWRRLIVKLYAEIKFSGIGGVMLLPFKRICYKFCLICMAMLFWPHGINSMCLPDILINVGSGNGLSLVRHQSITCTNADLSSIRTWRTYFNEILVEILKFSFAKMHFKMSSAVSCHVCSGVILLIINGTSASAG